jgi:vacuolar-type H+-ATPase subunit C/Vma6
MSVSEDALRKKIKHIYERIRILVPISQQIVGIFMRFLELEEKEILKLKLLAWMLAAAQKNPVR